MTETGSTSLLKKNDSSSIATPESEPNSSQQYTLITNPKVAVSDKTLTGPLLNSKKIDSVTPEQLLRAKKLIIQGASPDLKPLTNPKIFIGRPPQSQGSANSVDISLKEERKDKSSLHQKLSFTSINASSGDGVLEAKNIISSQEKLSGTASIDSFREKSLVRYSAEEKKFFLTIRSVRELSVAYIPYIKYCAFFLNTVPIFNLLEEVLLCVALPGDESFSNPLPAKIVLLLYHASLDHSLGMGVQLMKNSDSLLIAKRTSEMLVIV